MRKATDKKGHGLVGGVIVTVLVVGFVLLFLVGKRFSMVEANRTKEGSYVVSLPSVVCP